MPNFGTLKMATRNGLEPSTSSVTGWRANRLHHRAISLENLGFPNFSSSFAPLGAIDGCYYIGWYAKCQHLFSKILKFFQNVRNLLCGERIVGIAELAADVDGLPIVHDFL